MSLEQKPITNSPASLQDQCMASICKTYFFYYEELDKLLPPMLKEKLAEATLRCYESYDEDNIDEDNGRLTPDFYNDTDFWCTCCQ
jgi:hypothetical protein